MTTLIVHGTLAQGASWYKSSWSERGFLAGLQAGMLQANGTQDIWSVNGTDVSTIKGLGLFEWSGSHEGAGRGGAAQELARYLNQLAGLSSEPIRIVAHSHGCNVVKLASALSELQPRVRIEQAVFLACPHFSEAGINPAKIENWQDKFSFQKLAAHQAAAPPLLRYALDPHRFGRILNMYSEQDEVQVRLAQLFGRTPPPMTGTFWNNLKDAFMAGGYEMPNAARTDIDPRAAHLYDECPLQITGRGSGMTAHSALHGYAAAMFCGYWLNSGKSSRAITAQMGAPALSFDDLGA